MIMTANLGLRFFLEVLGLVSLGYWGFHAGQSTGAKIALGVGAPLLAAVVWGAFVAPAAKWGLGGLGRAGLELVVFGSATVALYAAGRSGLAAAFGVTVLLNRVLMLLWHQ